MQGPDSNVAARTPSSGSADAKPRFNLSASSIIPVDGCPSDYQVEFTINAETGQLARTPVDIVCVVDESYSMSSAASLNDDDASGTDEDAGLSISDIVRHAVKTVISVMGPEDRLALVGFSADARRVMGLTTMDSAGIAAAMTGADDLGPKNNTNLWAGIKEGLDVLHESVTSSSSAPGPEHRDAVDVAPWYSCFSKTKNTKNPPTTAATAPQRLRTILLLTDGEPNVEPQGGHLAALEEYFRTHPGLDSVTTINTFGFGYSLDSKLLKELSVRGAGMYSFIPDASFVGTAFVNTLSNIRTTAATGATLELTGVTAVEWLGEGDASSSATALKRAGTAASASPSEMLATAAEAAASIEERVQAAVGQAERDKEGQGKAGAIRFGSIQCQQRRHLIARITVADGAAGLTATLRCNAWDRACPESFTIAVDPTPIASASNHACMRQGASSASFAAQSTRLRFVDAINEATALFQRRHIAAAQAAMKDFVDGTANANGDEYVAAVLADATGQATQALSQEAWFARWGKHFLPSLAQAHLQQQCNNFKDPGVQLYGGAMFEQARDEADDAFLSLPPPKPSNDRRGRGATSSSASPAKVSMSRYHCASNGCFHGASMITMANGAAKRVDQLRKGDSVATPAGPATVGCVVESLCANGAAELVALGDGLLITPYHPVRGGAAGEWRFPHTMALRVSVACAAVYNVVLDRGHEVAINGIQCVTLAHGFVDSAVIRHPFFGTDRVTSALKQLPGWDNGWVRIQPSSLLRSRSTGLVIGYADNAAMPPTPVPMPPQPRMVSI